MAPPNRKVKIVNLDSDFIIFDDSPDTKKISRFIQVAKRRADRPVKKQNKISLERDPVGGSELQFFWSD